MVELGARRPRLLVAVVALLAVVSVGAMLRVSVDTDPETMLPVDNEVRVRNAEMVDAFGLRDSIVVGLVADGSITTGELLSAVAQLESGIASLDGVVADEVIGLSTAVGGRTALSSMLAEPARVSELVAAVDASPLLAGNVISSDGTTAAVFVPLESKGDANGVAGKIEGLIAGEPALASVESYLAGLPLAEEAFGRQMFIQMGIFAPLAGMLVFVLMMLFFRSVSLVMAAMALSLVTVMWTMGLFIGTGHTVHIMSSMIPIFLMPIAILDGIHVLSEFFDRYPAIGDRRKTLQAVYWELFKPITYTSLTTAVAFASLALTPIPPVQSFGIFVAIGVVFAWALTLVLIPAYVMLLSEERLRATLIGHPADSGSSRMSRWRSLLDPLRTVAMLERLAVRHRATTLVVFAAAAILVLPGLTNLAVSDNPVRWFAEGTEVRTANAVLNEKLPGTFSASLLLEGSSDDVLLSEETVAAVGELQEFWSELDVVGSTSSYADVLGGSSSDALVAKLDDALASPQGALVASLITSDGSRANLRLQMNDGDSVAMREVVEATDAYLLANPLPAGVSAVWAGEGYLNLVWQDEIAKGMLRAFLSTLAVVLVLMLALFRSVRWALLGVAPVLWTVAIVYGALGLLGRDYDAPIAILSTMLLGIGVDFAIHFVQRYRELAEEHGAGREALAWFFGEPARALTRNAVIIAVGFTPLLLSSLTPYIVTGMLLSSIMVLSWLATMVVLPSAVMVGRSDDDLVQDAVAEAAG